ncbi:MAG: ABC transporter ATP-binding protein [Chloroherpetonaceae bacterium]
MKLYFRVLKFLAPEKYQIALTVMVNFLASLFSVVSIGTLLPLLNAVFSPEAVTQSPEPTPPPSAEQTDFFREKADSFKNDLIQGFQQLVTAETREGTLLNVCLLLIGAFVLKNFFVYFSNQIVNRVETKTLKKLRDTVFEKIVQMELGYFNRNRVGTLMNYVMGEVNVVHGNIGSSFITFLRQFLNAAFFLAVLFVISWKLTFFAFAVSGLSLWSIRVLGRKIRAQADVVQAQSGDMNSLLQEVFNGIKVVKSNAMEVREAMRFNAFTDIYRRANLKVNALRGIISPFNETMGVAAIALVLWFGGKQVFAGEITSVELMVFAFALYSVMNPIKSIAENIARVQEGLSAAERLFALIDKPSAMKNGTKKIDKFEHEIRFEDVWFRYGEKPVLKGVSFTVKKGEMVGLVGQSGSGKSTIVDLLLRFYDVEHGRILIDGTDIREFDVTSLRRLFGVVNQEVILFNDTIAKNIAYGMQGEASLAQIEQAAKIANAHAFILEKPEQYQTLIGDRGVQLSGGQRQRISIARAMLKNPPVLIFDEATSALDNESEKVVQAAIENAMSERTAIVIAHRLSTLKNADKIIVMEQGEIIEQGSHAELMEKNGTYRRLYEMQFATQPIST